jgi:hypothetical protein
LRDPIVPLDFDCWARRVYRVFRNGLKQLGILAMIPVGLIGIYLVTISLTAPDTAEIKQRLAAAAAASPTGIVDTSTQFWIVFGHVLPAGLIFLILFMDSEYFYQACAHYVTLRTANGQPARTSEALRQTEFRILPYLGWIPLFALLVAACAFVMLTLEYLNPIGALNVAISLFAFTLVAGLSVFIQPTVSGVAFIERAGISRCVHLVKPRFWATLGRMIVTWLIIVGYALALLMLTWLLALPFGGLEQISTPGTAITTIIQLVLAIPAFVFTTAVSVVSYAELRFHENNSTSTRTLTAELTR